MSLLKAASTVSLLTLASRVTGLVRDLLMASVFGANALTHAFNVAFRIPNLFRRLFAEGAFSQAFVPVLANWLMKIKPHVHAVGSNGRVKPTRFDRFKIKYLALSRMFQQRKKTVVAVYAIVVMALAATGFLLIGTDIMPSSGTGDLQVRLVAPAGTRIEQTEDYLHQVTGIIAAEAE